MNDVFEQARCKITRSFIESYFSSAGAKWVGNEYYTLNPTRADSSVGSFSIRDDGICNDFADPFSKIKDVIDLLAAVKGISNKEAAEIIAGQKAERQNNKQQKKEEIKAVPVVDGFLEDLYKTLKNKPDMIHIYRNETGLIVYVITRIGSGQEKEIRPYVYDGVKWISRLPSERILYNADKLASIQNAPVVVVEGEKAADVRIDGYVLTTWPGGASAINKTDFSVLNGRNVYIVPDNDNPGIKAARFIQSKIKGSIVLDTSNYPEKWDLADSEDPEIDLYYLIESYKKKMEDEQIKKDAVGLKKPYRIIGECENKVCFFINQSETTFECGRAAITKETLKAIAHPDEYWKVLYPKYKLDSHGLSTGIVIGTDWELATSEVMDEARKAKKVDRFKKKKHGYFRCGNDIVQHLGDRLFVNNVEKKISEYCPDDIVFVKSEKINRSTVAANDEDLFNLARLFSIMQFENGRDEERLFFMSFCLFARVYPVMYWKPSVWLKAPAGEGKTWLKENIVLPLLCDNNLGVLGVMSPTEPAIRQDADGKSWPIIIDEAEQKTQDDATIDKIMKLVRATAGSGAEITRGTPDGTVKRYDVISSFMFISILSGLKEQADKDRIALINYKKLTGPEWERLETTTRELLTPDFCARVRTRIDNDHAVIIENIKTVTKELKRLFRMDQRSADQIGALIAPALYCFAPEKWSQQKAADMISDYDFSMDTEHKNDNDEIACMEELLNFKVRIDRAIKVTMTIREMIRAISENTQNYGLDDYEIKQELRIYNIDIRKGLLLYAASQDNKIFNRSQFAMNYKELLKRHPAVDHERSGKQNKLHGVNKRALVFDLDKLISWEKFGETVDNIMDKDRVIV